MKKTMFSTRWLPVSAVRVFALCAFALAMFTLTMPVHAEDGSMSAKDRAALLATASISCDAKRDDCTAGNIETGDFYDVSIANDCSLNAYYGRIGNKAADALDKVSTTDTKAKKITELPANQMVCILASASAGRGKSPVEHYVMALPWDYDAACTGNTKCRKPMPAPVPAAMRECKVDHEAKRYSNCPQGWVSVKDMEAYPMGLPGLE